MIPAKPTAFGRWFWQTTARIGIWRNFHEFILVDAVEVQSSKSVILAGNHISWWDGFWAMELNRRFWKKSFYVMMLEKQLKQRSFMRRTGAFSVKPGTRDALRSVQYMKELLEDPHNLVLMFPQGKIHSQHDQDFQFANGLQKILNDTPAAQMVFFASFVDYGSHHKPTVRLYAQMVEARANLPEAYSTFFRDAEKRHILEVNE